MTLPDVTEQRLTIRFVFTSKKTPMQISNILEEAEKIFKSIVRYKGFLRDGNSESNDCRPWRRRITCDNPV
jgi:hypothetical protein